MQKNFALMIRLQLILLSNRKEILILYIDWKYKMFYYLGKYLNPNVSQKGGII